MARFDRTLLALLLPLAVGCGGDDGTDAPTDDTDVDAENHAPGKPEVTITPADPVVGTELTATFTAVDEDGDALTYDVKWSTDATDVAFDRKAVTIPGDVVARGQTWTATVVANDGQVDSKPGKASITIGNALPTVTSFTWGPAAPTATDTLYAAGEGTDPDGDRVTVTYTWSVNGGSVATGKAASLAPGQFEKGDSVVVTLELDDKQGTGTTTQDSDPIVIGNTAPSAPTVHLTPRVAVARDTLTCELVAEGDDLDGDTLTYEISWLRDGTTVTTTPATVGVPVSQEATTGSVWTCTARSFDGTDRSPSAFASIRLGATVPDVADMSLGTSYSCASRLDGYTACWGLDGPADATTGLATGMTGRTHPPDVAFSTIAASDTWACGVGLADGALSCWGQAQAAGNPPVGVFAHVDAAGDNACAQAIDGTLACWRRGAATTPDAYVAPAGAWRTFGVGASHACAIDADGAITCWGLAGSPALTPPTGTFLTLTANGNHTCALADDGTIACWGDDSVGQLQAPTGTFSTLSAGLQHTCAVATDQTITCWGDDTYGQAHAPPGTFLDVWAGARHTCARDTDDAIVCWGDPSGGVLEVPWGKVDTIDMGATHLCTIDTAGAPRCIGFDVSGDTNAPFGDFVEIDAATTHTCARTAAGAITCWGANTFGQTTVPGTAAWDDVAAGLDFTCGIHSGTQDLACWGNPGQVAPIPGLGGSIQAVPAGRYNKVSAGGTFGCALGLDAKVTCWGQLGGGNPNDFVDISSGTNASCGLMSDGNVKCWDGLPVFNMLNSMDGDFSALSAGGTFACALGATDGALTCWGGLASLGQVPHPVASGLTQLSVGENTVCALDADGRPWCWGGWGRAPLDAGL